MRFSWLLIFVAFCLLHLIDLSAAAAATKSSKFEESSQIKHTVQQQQHRIAWHDPSTKLLHRSRRAPQGPLDHLGNMLGGALRSIGRGFGLMMHHGSSMVREIPNVIFGGFRPISTSGPPPPPPPPPPPSNNFQPPNQPSSSFQPPQQQSSFQPSPPNSFAPVESLPPPTFVQSKPPPPPPPAPPATFNPPSFTKPASGSSSGSGSVRFPGTSSSSSSSSGVPISSSNSGFSSSTGGSFTSSSSSGGFNSGGSFGGSSSSFGNSGGFSSSNSFGGSGSSSFGSGSSSSSFGSSSSSSFGSSSSSNNNNNNGFITTNTITTTTNNGNVGGGFGSFTPTNNNGAVPFPSNSGGVNGGTSIGSNAGVARPPIIKFGGIHNEFVPNEAEKPDGALFPGLGEGIHENLIINHAQDPSFSSDLANIMRVMFNSLYYGDLKVLKHKPVRVKGQLRPRRRIPQLNKRGRRKKVRKQQKKQFFNL